MAPPGPPPYTIEDIHNMTSPEERLRARAELNSYIARMKKEKQERLARDSYPNGYSSHASEYPRPPFSHRGGYSHSRGGSAYHPYQRSAPPHAAQKFRNKSVTFHKQDTGGEILEEKKAVGLTMNSTPGPDVQQHTESRTLCPAFTQTGVCTRHGCRHLHDPDKQAVCKRWLFKGDCPKGDSCPLSHDPSSHNAPTCQHFQEARCNNDNCRFSHVRINPAAPNCEAFGLLGYCEQGADCSKLHAHECPHFSNKGTCPYGDKCRLGHVHRASRMRKATSSKEDLKDTADSETWIGGSEQNPHHFTQQVDFVSLNADD